VPEDLFVINKIKSLKDAALSLRLPLQKEKMDNAKIIKREKTEELRGPHLVTLHELTLALRHPYFT